MPFGGGGNAGSFAKLTVSAPAGAAADYIVAAAQDSSADTGLEVQRDGTERVTLLTGASPATFIVQESDLIGTTVLLRLTAGANLADFGTAGFFSDHIRIDSLTLGFYGATPVTRPAHPTTLADVIAALTALGLTA